ncbi:putative Nuclear transcription factor Y subunit C-4 [Melia azedarach]|uniref:Nuclear transcription factor Y subunit C-4 n=1 Tax=Melia azedarach TaxID=155640 RepID=A0ACC1XZI3_MELAZ|nr:putative Nuclear transcription factor Y subunit C-4 [Melia azedarach]
MEMARGYRAHSQNAMNNFSNGFNHDDTLLVIKLPDPMFLRVISRSLFLAMLMLSLPCIGPILRESSASLLNDDDYDDSGLTNLEFMNLLLQDLSNEGLIKKGDKALLAGFGNLEPWVLCSRFFDDNEIHLVVESDLERLGSIKDGTFNFAFLSSSVDTKIVDHVLKVGGVVVVQLSNDISHTYQKQANYKIEYIRRYSATIVAMRKTGLANDLPRKALAKSSKLPRKIKFLPDLLGYSVGSYSRRVFIDVSLAEEKESTMDWFNWNYPMGQEFDIYSIELVTEESAGKITSGIDVSDWLKTNVKEEEYVVMKVEAEVAEKMIEKQTIYLVDELFLECKNQWQDEGKE